MILRSGKRMGTSEMHYMLDYLCLNWICLFGALVQYFTLIFIQFGQRQIEESWQSLLLIGGMEFGVVVGKYRC